MQQHVAGSQGERASAGGAAACCVLPAALTAVFGEIDELKDDDAAAAPPFLFSSFLFLFQSQLPSNKKRVGNAREAHKQPWRRRGHEIARNGARAQPSPSRARRHEAANKSILGTATRGGFCRRPSVSRVSWEGGREGGSVSCRRRRLIQVRTSHAAAAAATAGEQVLPLKQPHSLARAAGCLACCVGSGGDDDDGEKTAGKRQGQ